MVINTNTSAQSSARLLGESSAMLAKSLARLSSGSKIVSPEDDAAGLAVATRFDAQINRISATSNNYSMTGVDLGASAYTTATGGTVATAGGAATALTNVKAAIDQLATDRANIGANISRLNSTNEGLSVLKDNLSAANSRIKDVD